MITASKVFSGVPPLFSKLATILSGDIDCSHLALTSHSYDGSPYSIRPQAIVYPKTSSDIKHCIAFSREYGMPLTVCGGQSASSGGALGEGVILDMTRYFSKVRHVNMLDHTVTVDAGVSIDHLRHQLDGWNVEIPVLQTEDGKATVGGFVATKSATPSTFYAGTIREWIEGITVVVDSGEEHTIKDGVTPSGRLLGIYQSVFPLLAQHAPTLRASMRDLHDDATGYSVWNTSIGPRQLLDQLVGSEGTLAIITSITFRVVPKRLFSYTALVPAASPELLQTYTDIARHHNAEELFMLDATFRKFTQTFHPLLIPEAIPDTPFYLIVTMRGTDEHKLKEFMSSFLQALPEHTELYEVSKEAKEKLQAPHFVAQLFERYGGGTHMLATSGQGIIVPLHEYASCIREIDTLLGTTGILYALTGYAGSGHLAVHSSFDAKSPHYEEDLQVYRDHLLKTVASYGGGISAVGGDGLERTASLPLIFNEATRNVFKELKHAWDPDNLFNPSKKIAIGADYLMKHAARTFL